MSAKTHADAVQALLAADTIPVYVSRAPDDVDEAAGYHVLHPGTGMTEPADFNAPTGPERWIFQVSTWGVGREQVLDGASEVKRLLLGIRPVVDDYSCSTIGPPDGVSNDLGVDVDEDGQTPLFVARTLWVYVSTPA